MIGWFFKKPEGFVAVERPAERRPGPPAAPAATRPTATPKAAAATPVAPVAPAAPQPDWAQRLQSARGDDDALLALARDSAPLDIKLAAVGEIAGEAALRTAEREFRNHDRRVHRLAKQRHAATVAQRETRAQAAMIIATARELVGDEQLPVNRLVDLDRGWQALDSSLVDEAHRAEYAALLEQLSAAARDRADRVQRLQRWTAQSRAALDELRTVAAAAANGEQDRAALAAAAGGARELLDAAPAPGGELCSALETTLAVCAALDERLGVLEDLLQAPPSGPAAAESAARTAAKPIAKTAGETAVETPPEAASETPSENAAGTVAETASESTAEPTGETTAEIPAEMTTVTVAEIVAEVAVPHAEEAAAETLAQAIPDAVAEPAPSDAAERPAPVAPSPDPLSRWQQLPPLPDAALAEALNRRFEQWQQSRDQAHQARRAQQREQVRDRQRAERGERKGALEAALERAETALAAGHLAETHKHLLGIDELMHGDAAGEALRARAERLQAQYAQLKGWQHWAGGRARDELVAQAEALAAATEGTAAAPVVKLTIRQRSDVIDDMRARWKELDRLGGATSRTLWQRFEAALKVAHQPVAAQVAAQRAVREQNLQSRRQLIETLDAVPLPGAGEGDGVADWRDAAVALDRFHVAWRKLGPLEHTVPHAARDGLAARLAAAVQRIEAPLAEARRVARDERLALVAAARALADEAAAGAPGRELGERLRDLQAEWQRQAKALPLARGEENALWGDFRAAVDAMFSARDAVFHARDAEFRAHAAERLALVERLEALNADTPPAEIRRTLAEVDVAWRRAGPAPRLEAAALEARLQQAHDAAQRHLAGSAQRGWQLSCDALEAKLALCDSLEPAADAAPADLAERWAALPVLPAAWEQALARRAGLPAPAGRPDGAVPATITADDLLLQLEAAWSLPSPPAFEAERRTLKLQAMKAAMEGRRAAAAPTPEQWFAAALGRGGLDAPQRERLAAVIAALRRRGPARPG